LAANNIFRLHADLLALLKPLPLLGMAEHCAFGTAYLLGYLAQWRSVPVVNLLGSVPINHADIIWQQLLSINS
jgi:hypothetical protein